MSDSMRIAHVVRSTGFAGVEQYICTAARRQQQQGHQVTVIGGNSDRMAAELAATTIDWRPAATVQEAWRQVRSLPQPHIVHAHMTAGEWAAVGGAPRSARIVATRHFAATRGSTMLKRTSSGLLARRVSTQIAISRFVADFVEGDCVVIHPGTPGVTGRVGAAERNKVVLVAQRLEPEKRTDLALRLWAGSRLAEHGWRMHVAGSGALDSELRQLALNLGIAGSTDFLGALSDLDQHLRTASILLAPRHDEPYGLSVVEAMAAGLPVVAGAGGGHNETVGSCPGAVLVADGDLEGGSRLLRALALDVERRDKYGADLQRIQRASFAGDQQVDALTEIYRQALGR